MPENPSPTREDYLRATAKAVGLNPDAAVAHLDQTLAHNAEARAQSNVCERHHFVWTWPIEGGAGSVGVCGLCGAVTTGERDASTKAGALREAADQIEKFRDWYPTSVFPSLEEALSDGYEPSQPQIAAQCYRHAYGDLVPRNLRTWAREAVDGPGCDNCGGWGCDCAEGAEPCVHAWVMRPESDTHVCETPCLACRAERLAEQWERDDREHLNTFGQHLMGGAVLSCAEQLREALGVAIPSAGCAS